MNANAYGGELARTPRVGERLQRRRRERREPGDLGFGYRRSNLAPGEVVSRASFRLEPRRAGRDQGRAGARCASARREAQPSGIKTFGSTFTNPDPDAPGVEGRTAGQLLEAAGCRGLRHGGARFSDKHANFVENAGDATTADVLELMARGPPPRPRALRRRPRARGPGPRRGRVAATWELEGD